MTNEDKCPLCHHLQSRCVLPWNHQNIALFECEICGTYQLTDEAFSDTIHLTSYRRAVLSHKVRTASLNNDKNTPRITQDILKSWISNGTLPNPIIQTENLIRFIGDEVSRSGENITILPDCIYAVMGTRSYRSAIDLAKELQERKLLKMNPQGKDITLSLDGWERYEAEKRGRFSGNYGFIAMEFFDTEPDPFELDSFIKGVVKPAVEDDIGYNIVDIREVSQAGIIDNIMRVQIRGSAFVIADLTHDNHGAYWEAGYAEGLGKPVVYICEKTKFKSNKPHFDTNHCTTVLWSKDDPKDDSKEFRNKLIATLRRSLNLPPTGT